LHHFFSQAKPHAIQVGRQVIEFITLSKRNPVAHITAGQRRKILPDAGKRPGKTLPERVYGIDQESGKDQQSDRMRAKRNRQ